jgi:large subunit ribosomal protein L5
MSSLNLSTNQYKDQGSESVAKAIGGSVNLFELPSIAKVSINIGVGKYENKDKQTIAEYIHKITGQKPKMVKSRVSISNFKLRKGDITGIAVTLRGQRAYDFILSLIYIALPRIRDFKGLKKNAFDKSFSSYSMGIESSSIFPHVGFDIGVNFGMQINIVFKTKTEQNRELLKSLNFPFIKD